MKKLFMATLCMLALPILFSPSESSIVAPGSTVALAGHTSTGNWCECGCLGCICDPDEQPTLCMDNAASTKNNSKGAKAKPAPSATPESTDFDFGSSALLVALALLMLRRMMF